MGAMRDADLELPVPLGVRAVLGEVMDWSPENRWVELATGERFAFDHVVWAVGAQARRFEGAIAPGFPVYALQTIGDAHALAEASPARWGVVGGGLVGAELAEWGVGRGAATHWWVREERLWEGRLNVEESAALARRVRGFGVQLELGTSALSLGWPVVTTRGAADVDAVGVAIGVEPAPIPGGHGLADLAAMPGVHAVGDVATSERRSWAAASADGRALGRALTGVGGAPRPVGIDDRVRCFDRTVTLLSCGEVEGEVGYVDEEGGRSLRLGWDAEGRWVRAVSMGWKLRADRIKSAFAAGFRARDVLDGRRFFNEPEGTKLPLETWSNLLKGMPR